MGALNYKTQPHLQRVTQIVREYAQTAPIYHPYLLVIFSRPNITALGEVLEEVEALNHRLQPHLERFTQIVREDAQTDENVRTRYEPYCKKTWSSGSLILESTSTHL